MYTTKHYVKKNLSCMPLGGRRSIAQRRDTRWAGKTKAATWDPSWKWGAREDRTLERERGNQEAVGVSATEEFWQFDPLGLGARSQFQTWQEYDAFIAYFEASQRQPGGSSKGSENDIFSKFSNSQLPNKILQLLVLIVISRVGVYVPLPGVDTKAFSDSVQEGGLLSYIDALSGGSISKVGVFSLGIVPYINASIIFQLLTSVFPSLKTMQREDGQYGRQKFQRYQKYVAMAFALVQAFGQCLYIRPYVTDFDLAWLATSVITLTAGAAALIAISDEMGELKLGNGTSLLIFVNIASSVPSSLGQLFNGSGDASDIAVFFTAFFLTCAGIVYVQEAERKIPINYAQRYSTATSLARSSYLPFKVNAAGVMPVIFSSSLLALPSALARFTSVPAISNVAKVLGPGGNFYLPLSVSLIAFFNYFYTFLQLEPDDLAQQLKRQGASIPSIRPGKNTSEYITQSLERMSVLGSVFLGGLALAPGIVEALTEVKTLRGFAGTSLLILVGVATDTARRFKAELQMAEYKVDNMYDDIDMRKL